MVLQSIRDRLTGIIAIFILGLLVVPFAFVGVSSYFTSDAVNSVAVVNDQEITISQFNQGFQNYRRRMQSQLGSAFDPVYFDQPIVRRQFLDQMIDEQLLIQVSTDAGLAVDSGRLAQRIRNFEAFQVDGEFNADLYQARLSAQGTTPQQFEAEIRGSMVLGQFPSTIASSAIATDWELNDYARLQEQERGFKAIIVPAFPAADEEIEGESEEESVNPEAPDAEELEVESPEPDTEPVDEEAVLAWYEDHQSEYMSQEMVIIEYLELEAAAMPGSLEPDEEVLKARFEDQKIRFMTPEARLASHILIEVDAQAAEVEVETGRRQAEELSRRAKEGEDFAELARQNSQDIGSASEGGDLGWIEPGFMVQAFEDGLYSLSPESPVSEPIQTGYGWHVIYLRDIRPAEGMTYTEARETLLSEYNAEADERQFLEQADRLVDIIYEDPTTLDAAADELGLDVREAGPFGRSGGEGVAANQEVVNAAFSDLVLAQGAVSDPIDLGVNHIALVRVKEHLPSALKSLDEVRDQVVESVRYQHAMQAASATAEELLARLEAGAGIPELAETEGLDVVEADAARRIGSDIDPRLIEQVFLLETPSGDVPVTAVVELDGAYALVQLESVTDGVLTEEDQARSQAYGRRIQSATASSEALAFLRMLRAQSTIEVFEDRL